MLAAMRRGVPCAAMRSAAHAPRTASRHAPRRLLAGARRPKRRDQPSRRGVEAKPPPYTNWWKEDAPPDGESAWRTFLGIAKFGLYFYGVTTYVVDLTLCTGPSMEPMLHNNSDLVLLDRLSPFLGRIKRGDIVVADSPTRPGQTVCKRIAAVAGEPIPNSFFKDAVVPPDCVWLLGDNRHNSTDSRIYGPVPAEVVKGRVLLRVWPLDQVRVF
jgi:inner membrane protease subunit 1